MSERLAGRTAIVTGASCGIGRAIAVALAREGCRIAIAGRTEELLRDVAREIQEAGSRALMRVLDVRREEDLRQLVADTQAELGPLDVMVNNAGVGYRGPVVKGEAEHWREMLETNLLGLFVGCREAVRAMTGRGGHIVNVSSLAGREPTPGDAVYGATKHAVNAFSASLRQELSGTGIRVLVVEPGPVVSSFGRTLPREVLAELAPALGLAPDAVPDFSGGHLDPESARRILDAHRDRFLAPEDVARAVVHALTVPEEVSYPSIAIRPEARGG
jgi:NADP-dependent 3-hydroxy acid dehydrogenase YdfG